MSLFIRYVNPEYSGILKNDPFAPQTYIHKTTVDGKIVPAYWTPKKVTYYIDTEKENVALDDSIQFIVIESLDNIMYNKIVNCTTAK